MDLEEYALAGNRIVIVAAELICQKIDGLICHGQPN